jgi:hypothetical protein
MLVKYLTISHLNLIELAWIKMKVRLSKTLGRVKADSYIMFSPDNMAGFGGCGGHQIWQQ